MIEIISNIKLSLSTLYANIEKIDVIAPKTTKIIPFLKQELKKLMQLHSNAIIFIAIRMAGRRVIEKNNFDILSGRRHRMYYAIAENNKMYIKFCWHKIKKLTEIEKEFIYKNWHLLFFEQEGKFLIEKSGGSVFFENLLYKINILEKNYFLRFDVSKTTDKGSI